MARGYQADGGRRLGAPHDSLLPRRGRVRGALREHPQPRSSPASSTACRSRRSRWARRSRASVGPAGRASARGSTPGTRAATRRRASARLPADRRLPAQPGDLDGAKANPPYHTTVQQLPLPPRLPHRPHPLPRDHRHRHRRRLPAAARARRRAGAVGPGVLRRSVAGIASWAVYAAYDARAAGAPRRRDRSDARLRRRATASSSPSSTRVLFPLAGLDNPVGRTCKRYPRAARPRARSCTCSEPCDRPPDLHALFASRARRRVCLACGDNQTYPDRQTPTRPGLGAAALVRAEPRRQIIESNELQPALGVAGDYLVNAAGHDAHRGPRRARSTRSGQLRVGLGRELRRRPDRDHRGQPRSRASGTRRPSPTGSSSRRFDAADTLEAVYSTTTRRSTSRASPRPAEPAQRQDALRLRRSPSPSTQFPLTAGRDAGRRRATSKNGTLDGLPYAGDRHLPGHRRRHRAAHPARLHLHAGAPGAHDVTTTSPPAASPLVNRRPRSSSSASARWPARPARPTRRTTTSPPRPRCAASACDTSATATIEGERRHVGHVEEGLRRVGERDGKYVESG